MSTNDIAESFMAFNTNYNDTGLFGVYASCEPKAAGDLSWLIMNEVTRLVYQARRKKALLKRRLFLASILWFKSLARFFILLRRCS